MTAAGRSVRGGGGAMTACATMTRARRSAAALSMNALARAAGIDPAYVLRIERGTHRPSRSVALELARVLGLDALETDRYLFAAGHAPERDWQAIAEDYRRRLDAIDRAVAGLGPGPRPLEQTA